MSDKPFNQKIWDHESNTANDIEDFNNHLMEKSKNIMS